MTKEAMDHFGLVQGQTILEFKIAQCQEKIAEKTAAKFTPR